MNYRTSHDGSTLIINDDRNQLVIRSSALSNVGMVRGNNEDNVEIWAFEQFMLGLVADGMGGAAGGEEASQLAVEAVQIDFVEALDETDALREVTEDQITDMLRHALVQANQMVLEKASQDTALHGMGTTATMVLLHGTKAIFAHIGDSRGYLIDGHTGMIDRVTNDHSFVEALVVSGHLTKEQAEVHPMRNVLYRALGQKGEEELEIDIYVYDLNVGDRLVLCSDGLPRHVKDHEIAEIAMSSSEPQEIAQMLIDLANERGGEDNVSAVVLLIENMD